MPKLGTPLNSASSRPPTRQECNALLDEGLGSCKRHLRERPKRLHKDVAEVNEPEVHQQALLVLLERPGIDPSFVTTSQLLSHLLGSGGRGRSGPSRGSSRRVRRGRNRDSARRGSRNAWRDLEVAHLPEVVEADPLSGKHVQHLEVRSHAAEEALHLNE
eukprot:6945121-Lingulodinium_polyedra.AAC.1